MPIALAETWAVYIYDKTPCWIAVHLFCFTRGSYSWWIIYTDANCVAEVKPFRSAPAPGSKIPGAKTACRSRSRGK